MMSTLTSLDHTVMALFFQKLTFARPFMTFRNSEIVIFIKWYHASTFIFGEKGMKNLFCNQTLFFVSGKQRVIIKHLD